MNEPVLIQGEHRRLYDDRFRVSLPAEFVTALGGEDADCLLAKEREGCISVWNRKVWEDSFGAGVKLVRTKLEVNRLQKDFAKVQRFGRLLSTLTRPLKLGHRGRLLIPEGFREFLLAEPNSEVIVVGAGVCLEVWKPEVWKRYVCDDIGEFQHLLQELAG